MEQKIITITLAILILASAFLLSTSLTGNPVKEKETIEIGATFPLTGKLSTYGQAYKTGMELAIIEVNADNGINGKTLKVEFLDNKGVVKEVTNDVNYLTQIKKVPLVYNSLSFLTLASYGITEKENTTVIAFTTYRFDNKDEPVFTFRDYWDFEAVGKSFAQEANNREANKAGMLCLTTSDQKHFSQAFKKNFQGEVVEESFTFTDSDFKTPLLKLKEKNMDTIVIYGYENHVNQILKEMEILGMNNINVFVTEGTEISVTQNNLAILEKTNAVSYLSLNMQDNNFFRQKYLETYNKEPRIEAYIAYSSLLDSVKILEICDKQNNLSGDCIREQLIASGEYDENNNKYRDTPIVQMKNGSWHKI